MRMRKFFYRVKSGDCAVSVASKFGTSVFSLISDNRLTRELEEGDVVFVFVRGEKTYTVDPTDSFKSVALKTGESEESVKSGNGGMPYLLVGAAVNY